MIYLLDTHYVLWSLFEPHKIKGEIRQILEDENDTKVVSGVTLWEISLKYALGKLDMGGTNPDDLFEQLIEDGFEIVSLDNRLLATYYQLPRKKSHKDPFDRLLVWQAMVNQYTLITNDDKIKLYQDDGLDVVIG